MPRFTPSYVQKRLECDDEQALKVSGLLLGTIEPLSFESAERYERQCCHSPGRDLLVLYAIDEVLGTCGVESWATSQHGGVSYCNTGDAYAMTVCLVVSRRDAKFRLACWANFTR